MFCECFIKFDIVFNVCCLKVLCLGMLMGMFLGFRNVFNFYILLKVLDFRRYFV